MKVTDDSAERSRWFLSNLKAAVNFLTSLEGEGCGPGERWPPDLCRSSRKGSTVMCAAFVVNESKILVHVLAQWGTVHLILESLSHATHRERDTAVSLTLSGEGGSLEPIRNEDHASLSNARLSTGAARLGGRTPPRAGVRKRDFQNGGSVQV